MRLVPRITSLVMIVLAVSAMLLAPAQAHATLIESNPADQQVLTDTPDAIAITFDRAVNPVGEGILISDEFGNPVSQRLERTGDESFQIVPEEALVTGWYFVSWVVQSGDAHPREGSFTFGLDLPHATTTTTSQPPTTPPTSSTLATTTTPATTSQAPTTEAPSDALPVPRGPDTPGTGLSVAPAVAVVDSLPSEWPERFARMFALVGALLAIGATIFSVSALVGTEKEIDRAVTLIRIAAAILVVGAAGELVFGSRAVTTSMSQALSFDALLDVLTGPSGGAIALRFFGGLGMLFGLRTALTDTDGNPVERGQLVAHPQTGPGTLMLDRKAMASNDVRLDLRSSLPAVTGATFVALSFLFDGHTASASPTLLVRSADLVHVVAASVWVGGVAMIAWVLGSRFRKGQSLRGGDLVVRFSTIASFSLIALAVAGVVLAITIADPFSDLWATTWGKLLGIKLVAVLATASIGGYNRQVIVPLLAEAPESYSLSEKLRRTLLIEAGLLVLVIFVTALLIGAAT